MFSFILVDGDNYEKMTPFKISQSWFELMWTPFSMVC
jgi:hypothetical protein